MVGGIKESRSVLIFTASANAVTVKHQIMPARGRCTTDETGDSSFKTQPCNSSPQGVLDARSFHEFKGRLNKLTHAQRVARYIETRHGIHGGTETKC